MKLKFYVFISSAAPGCSFLRVIKAIVVEYKSSGTGVRIHSILHFFMASYNYCYSTSCDSFLWCWCSWQQRCEQEDYLQESLGYCKTFPHQFIWWKYYACACSNCRGGTGWKCISSLVVQRNSWHSGRLPFPQWCNNRSEWGIILISCACVEVAKGI